MNIAWEVDSSNIHMGYVGGRLFYETGPGGRLLDYKDHHTHRCGSLAKAKSKADKLLTVWRQEADEKS